ncbi:hypothetical protein QJS10_CPB18g00707 [Acorus calamus]|uniref:Reverse transcriptase domain-containing protein n=1 Tax=Acorus calamus TaxID=4465 RepID=A0AAV9CLK0_ACOCL|nr:hypothetical protein QJS10_CPB18g00707 [Acorus calamus]
MVEGCCCKIESPFGQVSSSISKMRSGKIGHGSLGGLTLSFHKSPLRCMEIITNLHKDNRAGLVLNLDFAKAYDRDVWDFLFLVMALHGFSPNWIGMLKHCLGTAKASVTINDAQCGFFSLNRDLRQGDPCLQINWTKSSMWAINVESRRAESIATKFGCAIQRAPPSHLSLPLVQRRLLRKDWNPLVEQFEKKLAEVGSHWGSPLLQHSFGGSTRKTKFGFGLTDDVVRLLFGRHFQDFSN